MNASTHENTEKMKKKGNGEWGMGNGERGMGKEEGGTGAIVKVITQERHHLTDIGKMVPYPIIFVGSRKWSMTW